MESYPVRVFCICMLMCNSIHCQITCVRGTHSTFLGYYGEWGCYYCNKGKFQPYGNTYVRSCSDCLTGKYQAKVGKYYCDDCPVGKYNAYTGKTVCSECPPGTYQNLTGQVQFKVCPAGNYSLGGGSYCPSCEVGKYGSALQKSTCTLCSQGSYNNETGMASNASCVACEPGKYQNLTGASVCRNCIGSGIFECNQCGVGTYFDDTFSICISCETGKYQNSSRATTCKVCESGTSTSGVLSGVSSCSTCSAGTVAQVGQIECIPCLSGQYKANVSTCLNCSAGSFNQWNSSQWDTVGFFPICSLCLPGTYIDRTGQTACIFCPKGMYQEETGKTDCGTCPAGTYGSQTGQSACISCHEGTYQAERGKSNCSICPNGMYASVGQSTCIVCGVGFYDPPPDLEICRPCGSGFYQDVGGESFCKTCPAGKYLPTTQGISLENCLECPIGAFTAQNGSSACLFCVPGKYQFSLGASFCANCIAGQYSTMDGSTVCSSCVSGKYQEEVGGTTCIQCPVCKTGMYLGSGCNGSHAGACLNCTVCQANSLEVRICTSTSDTVCGSIINCTAENRPMPVEYAWLGDTRCKGGYFLRGYDIYTQSKDCLPCPSGWVGLNGRYCERCNVLEEPYYLDQASCVCTPPAVMNSSGGCVCPSGYTLSDSINDQACVPCNRNTFGSEGLCWPCGAGNTTFGMTGMDHCQQCEFGKYRLNGQEECQACSLSGWYAPDSSVSVCIQCNTSCTDAPGWRRKGECPGDATGDYQLCEPCPGGLPENAVWVEAEPGLAESDVSQYFFTTCAFKCKEGYFHGPNKQCLQCSNITECEDLSYRLTPCSSQADSHCETPCKNDTKAAFNSKWLPGCQWGCQDGYEVAVGDYWMFVLYECRPSGLNS